MRKGDNHHHLFLSHTLRLLFQKKQTTGLRGFLIESTHNSDDVESYYDLSDENHSVVSKECITISSINNTFFKRPDCFPRFHVYPSTTLALF